LVEHEGAASIYKFKKIEEEYTCPPALGALGVAKAHAEPPSDW